MYLGLLQSDHANIVVAECCVAQAFISGCGFGRAWANVNFASITQVLLPLNLGGNHWTLMVM